MLSPGSHTLAWATQGNYNFETRTQARHVARGDAHDVNVAGVMDVVDK